MTLSPSPAQITSDCDVPMITGSLLVFVHSTAAASPGRAAKVRTSSAQHPAAVAARWSRCMDTIGTLLRLVQEVRVYPRWMARIRCDSVSLSVNWSYGSLRGSADHIA